MPPDLEKLDDLEIKKKVWQGGLRHVSYSRNRRAFVIADSSCADHGAYQL
jgi:hypothetical protein